MFKSFDGWKPVSVDGAQKVFAHFTKDDGAIVTLHMGKLARLQKEKPAAYNDKDRGLITWAMAEGPTFFRSFDGWHNYGRGKTIMIAHFTKASGEPAKYSPGGLEDMAHNPPKKFSSFDAAVLHVAIESGPRLKQPA